jgi:hypothetical protein
LRAIAYLGFAAAGVLLVLMIWAASHPTSPVPPGATANGRTTATASAKATEPVPAYFRSAAAAQPYPTLVPAVDFSRDPVVERAYAVAAKIPGVLAQQPCYCHCDRMGHRSLLDCYASDHAAGCDICLMEGLFAGQMTQQGQSPATIRQEIIQGEWRDVRLSEPLR